MKLERADAAVGRFLHRGMGAFMIIMGGLGSGLSARAALDGQWAGWITLLIGLFFLVFGVKIFRTEKKLSEMEFD